MHDTDAAAGARPPTPPIEAGAGTVEVETAGAGADDVPHEEFRRLDARYIDWMRRRGLLRTALLAVLLGAVAFIARGRVAPTVAAAAWLAVLLPVAWHALAWPVIAFRHISYRVSERGVDIRRGVIIRSSIHVPRNRIQHTDVSQGPFERELGLGTLTLYTAGTTFASIELHGIARDTAFRIRSFLLRGAAGDDV